MVIHRSPLAYVTQDSPAAVRPLWRFFAETFAAWEQSGRNRDFAKDAGGVSSALDWIERHGARIDQAARDFLPSGSGFDSGTQFNYDDSRPARLRFETAFHHMNSAGSYDGWTHHTVTLRPSFGFPEITVSGRDRNGIKGYIAASFAEALATPVALIHSPEIHAKARVDSLPRIREGELVDSAASLWEAVLDRAQREFQPGGAREAGTVSKTLGFHGYAAVRQCFADMASAAHIGWTVAAREGFDSSFDWEFCPSFLARAVDFGDGSELPALRSDWREICREIGRADAARAAPPSP